MFDVNEKDWKIFRKKIIVWQENHMEKLNKEYLEILQSDNIASTKFWNLEKRIFKDKKSIGVVIDMRRSKMHLNILDLIREGIITFEDLSDFSEEFQSEIKMFLDKWK